MRKNRNIMFDTKDDLYEFLLTNDFKDKYTELEYRYFLVAFKELFRRAHSEKSRLNKEIDNLKHEISRINAEKNRINDINTVHMHHIKELKKVIYNRKPWYIRLFTSKKKYYS